MENDQFKQFVQQISINQERKNAEEKKKKYFREIGKKGGLKKKTSNQFLKVVSVRLTEKEFAELSKKAASFNLKISKYLRLLFTEKELKVNEFKTDKTLLEYGNNFIRIKNLLRHREFSEFQNKKEILDEIEKVTTLIRQYLYEKQNQKEEDESDFE